MEHKSFLTKVKNDAKLVKEIGRIILTIDENGKILEAIKNQDWSLNVIAVLGPATIKNERVAEIILLEIGIGATRPYHASSKRKPFINYRKKVAHLTRNQYLKIKSVIFQLVKQLAYEKISSWEHKTWVVLKKRNLVKLKKGIMYDFDRWFIVPTGVRFSVSKEDFDFLVDIYCAELNSNKAVREKLFKIGRFIDKCLNRGGGKRHGYEKSFYTDDQIRYMIRTSGPISFATEAIQRNKLLPHQLLFIKRNCISIRRTLFEQLVEHVVDFSWGKIDAEEFLRVESLIGDFSEQENGLRIRTIIPNLKKRDFVVFEVCLPELIKDENCGRIRKEDGNSTPF